MFAYRAGDVLGIDGGRRGFRLTRNMWTAERATMAATRAETMGTP